MPPGPLDCLAQNDLEPLLLGLVAQNEAPNARNGGSFELHTTLLAPFADLEWLAMAPVLLGQFRIYYDQQKPVGVVFWGFVMPEACLQHGAEVEARLAQGVTRLKPQDWESGDRLWVIEVIAPFGPAGGGQASSAGGGQTNLADEMVQDLKAKAFAGRELKVLAVEDGQFKVRVV